MDQLSDLRPTFAKLGQFLRDYCEYSKKSIDLVDYKDPHFVELDEKVVLAGHHNGWFTRDNVLFCLEQWGAELTREHIDSWLNRYPRSGSPSKKVGVVMAGNIPLVGLHDFLCVLAAGHTVLAKLSSNDAVLLPYLASLMVEWDPVLKDRIEFVTEKLQAYEAVIATGSNNTARYFEHYFGKVPHIIRRNRNSVAVLTGEETEAQLQALGRDVFTYFGLGCRSVSKLYVPEGYDFDAFFQAIFVFQEVINHHKYANNYDYNKAVYLMGSIKLLDNNFLVLKEDTGYSSPIAALFYQRYQSLEQLQELLKQEAEQLQCVVSENTELKGLPFGQTQCPKLWDYADGVDTMTFLSQL